MTAASEKAHLVQRPDDRGVPRDTGKEGPVIGEPVHHMYVNDITGRELRHQVGGLAGGVGLVALCDGVAGARERDR